MYAFPRSANSTHIMGTSIMNGIGGSGITWPTPGYVWFFYVLNTVMVSFGILLYFRNRQLDRRRMSVEKQK